MPNTPDTKLLKWFEQRSSLKQIITDITRFSTQNSTIDLIFTDSLCICNSGTLDVNLSDHEMIFVTRKHVGKGKDSTSFNGRSYVNYDVDVYIAKLYEVDWTPIFNMLCPNEAWDFFKNIETTIDKKCPTKHFKIKQVKDPWITNEILEAIHDKDLLLARAKRSDLQVDWEIARRRRNEVKNLTKHAKSNFIKDNLVEHKNDSKKFWKSLSNILPTKANKKYP